MWPDVHVWMSSPWSILVQQPSFETHMSSSPSLLTLVLTGEPYEGSFQDGLRHGQGRQVYGGRPLDGWGGDVYEGDWFEDKRSGRGTLTLGNGDVYEGSWQADLKHGEGTYYYMAKNKRYDGIWSEGTAKCGTYSEIQQSLPGDPGMLPVLELARPRAVIDDARATIIKTHMATTQE